MTEKRRASEVRQVELTDAALRIIASKGIASLSTRRLAEEVGLSTGAIFKHFPTKAELVAAAAAQLFDDLIDDFDIRRGCVRICIELCNPGAGDYHEASLPGDIIGTEGG